MTAAGNFEGRNILHLPGGPEAPSRPASSGRARRLYELRSERVWPGLDDKRLLSWNALMIAALADAGAVLGRADYLDAAVRCAEFITGEMRDADGRLLRTWKEGEGRLNAYLEDHAYLVEALLILYEATFDVRWFDAARETADAMIERFADPERGGFFTTSHDHEELIARRKDVEDHPIPSGNSAAAYALLRLAALTGEHAYERARRLGVPAPRAASPTRHPQAVGHLLRAIDFHLADVQEVALVAPTDATAALAAVVRSELRPHLVLAGGPEGTERPELMRERDRGRRQRRRLRLRALRLPAAGDRARRARRAARRTQPGRFPAWPRRRPPPSPSPPPPSRSPRPTSTRSRSATSTRWSRSGSRAASTTSTGWPT